MHGLWRGQYLFVDPSIKYLGKKHLPYAISGYIIALIWGLFSIFLLLYPTLSFQKLLNKSGIKSPTLCIFMRCFQGHYRDRTDGGIECRYYSAVYPILRVTCFIIFGSSHDLFASSQFVIILMIVGLILTFSQPYRH